jgi:hypothetical protein
LRNSKCEFRNAKCRLNSTSRIISHFEFSHFAFPFRPDLMCKPLHIGLSKIGRSGPFFLPMALYLGLVVQIKNQSIALTREGSRNPGELTHPRSGPRITRIVAKTPNRRPNERPWSIIGSIAVVLTYLIGVYSRD